MDLEDFAARFRADIRARLDWRRLAEVRAGVRVETLSRDTAGQRLAELFTVWYVDPAGGEGSWGAPGSRPLRVEAADRALPDWPGEREGAVSALARAFAEGAGPLPLTLPAYRVDEARYLLLDGNHRAVAAHRAGRALRLTLWSLAGPVCEGILPDLRHYAAPLA
ncbi:hypothetical protein ACF061_07055 [Streptomyces sp. NPDC015220]|uniref:hypothetical protein n=1 Tax=Streptomyces sp. NPDC015220 TaxID=3364947 RepID=UPI0036FE32DC